MTTGGIDVRRRARPSAATVLTAAALAAGLAVRLSLVLGDDSIYWPDEIHKTLEPAHRVAFGYGLRAWEFVRGAGNWAFPAVLAAVMKAVDAAGGDNPRAYLVAIRTLLALGSLAAAYAAWRIARSWRASAPAASVAAVLTALAAPAVYFSHRALTETASLAPVAFGVWLTLRGESTRRHVLGGGALLGAATVVRPHNALFALAVLGVLAAQRERARFAAVTATLAGATAFLGVLDWLTWGAPFHSLVEYAEATFREGVARHFGTAPVWYYARFLVRSLGPVSVLVGALAVAGALRAPAVAAVAATFLVAHSLEPHKEARFILPALPLVFAVAAVGVDVVARNRPRLRATLVGVVTLALVVQAATVRRLTTADVAQDHLLGASASAYYHGTPVNRLLLAASARPDLCGLWVQFVERVWTGGYSYLHRDVPLYGREVDRDVGAHVNYVIRLYDPTDSRYVAVSGGLGLLRTGDRCRPDPAWDDRL